jgi:hypothetical protein
MSEELYEVHASYEIWGYLLQTKYRQMKLAQQILVKIFEYRDMFPSSSSRFNCFLLFDYKFALPK